MRDAGEREDARTLMWEVRSALDGLAALIADMQQLAERTERAITEDDARR